MSYTQLGIYNDALAITGNSPLVSLSDNVAARYALDGVWTNTVAQLVEGALWKFATRAASFSDGNQNVTTTYNNGVQQGTASSPVGFVWVFTLPDDYVRIVRISDNNRYRPTLLDWEIQKLQLFTDAAILYLEYVSNDATNGGYNLSNWTPSFATAVRDELALRAAPLIMQPGMQKIEALRKAAKTSFYMAKQRDAVNQPESWPPVGRLVRSRSGWHAQNSQRRTPYYY